MLLGGVEMAEYRLLEKAGGAVNWVGDEKLEMAAGGGAKEGAAVAVVVAD